MAAVAAAAAVAVTGAESAAPPAVGERHLPPREAQATPAAAPAFVSRLAPKHALEQAERSRGTTIDTGPGATAPPAGASAAGAAQPTAPIRVSQPELPKLVVHVPALPLRLPPLAAELPKELEGTLAPQLDGVLAGR